MSFPSIDTRLFLLSGAMRVMVSHGSKGGFHSNIVDEVDSPLIAAVDSDAVRNGYKSE